MKRILGTTEGMVPNVSKASYEIERVNNARVNKASQQ